MAINFFFQKEFDLKRRTKIKAVIAELLNCESKKGSINYIFCDNKFILDINKRYLTHNYFTDVISFNLSSPNTAKISGEIYISIETVQQNSIDYAVSFETELLRVIFHGALHLCGYEDTSPNEKAIMTAKENHYLELFHVER